jgi:hypothetical protein
MGPRIGSMGNYPEGYIDVWLRIPEGEEEAEAEANTRLTELGYAVDWYLTAVGLVTSVHFDTLADAYDFLEAEGFEDYSVED